MPKPGPATLIHCCLFFLLLTIGCNKTEIATSGTGTGGSSTGGVPVDDALKATTNLYGTVLDESNVPVAGAGVVAGTASSVTDAHGVFRFNNVQLSKNNGSVTVTKTGYFKGIRSFRVINGKDNLVKIKLMQKLLSGTVTAASGGLINANGGATISFPANAFITGSGAVYSGTVNVYARWIDPASSNLPFIMPGDLRGVTTTGVENILETYGMVGAELEDASGNPLKIATGKTAAVSFPIPAAIIANAPDTIQLWHFDESAARWKAEGSAKKTGNTYQAQVNKFSFWNCDIGREYFIQLNYTLINNATGSPLVGAATRLREIPNGNYSGNNYSNNTGFVSGLVPRGQAFELQVLSDPCGTVIYSQNIGPFAIDTDLGNLNVTLPVNAYVSFSGKITNCSGAPVSNGYISLFGAGGNNGFANTNASGSFSFSLLNCSGGAMPYTYMATDNATSQQSTLGSGSTLPNTAVDLGTIIACGAAPGVNVYITGFQPLTPSSGNNAVTVWKNGTATALTDGTANGLGYGIAVSAANDVYVTGIETDNATTYSKARVWKNGSVLYTLTNGTDVASANAIAVSGNDVYVVGNDGPVYKIWKNGVGTTLNNAGGCKAIAISGTDVYVAGSSNYAGQVWKNGVPYFSYPNSTEFTAICVVGTDVYLAGNSFVNGHQVAAMWKNGVITTLDNGTTSSQAFGVAASGSDVYVVGIVNNPTGFFTVATVWKNGVATSLTNGLYFGYAVAVQTLGNDVYIVGYDSYPTGNEKVVLWKNNLPVNITDGLTVSSFPTALFVK